jgi:hypothetical protein
MTNRLHSRIEEPSECSASTDRAGQVGSYRPEHSTRVAPFENQNVTRGIISWHQKLGIDAGEIEICLRIAVAEGCLEQHIVHKPHKLIDFEGLLDDHRAIGFHVGKPGFAVEGCHDKDRNTIILKLLLD